MCFQNLAKNFFLNFNVFIYYFTQKFIKWRIWTCLCISYLALKLKEKIGNLKNLNKSLYILYFASKFTKVRNWKNFNMLAYFILCIKIKGKKINFKNLNVLIFHILPQNFLKKCEEFKCACIFHNFSPN